ncbi:DUF397 domain-containing protein [Streptomyces sp. NPDC059743]|uniref:DUF397 domain-containing protein n=1 Tax=Streptomyces sp. NPDC059743 TaxID=3346928 RepID=UPI003648505F
MSGIPDASAPVAWRRSSYSGGGSNGGDCVEVAGLPNIAAVRDSKKPPRIRPDLPRSGMGAVHRCDEHPRLKP